MIAVWWLGDWRPCLQSELLECVAPPAAEKKEKTHTGGERRVAVYIISSEKNGRCPRTDLTESEDSTTAHAHHLQSLVTRRRSSIDPLVRYSQRDHGPRVPVTYFVRLSADRCPLCCCVKSFLLRRASINSRSLIKLFCTNTEEARTDEIRVSEQAKFGERRPRRKQLAASCWREGRRLPVQPCLWEVCVHEERACVIAARTPGRLSSRRVAHLPTAHDPMSCT